MSYKIKIEETEIDLSADQLQQYDIVKGTKDAFHILQNNQSYDVKLIDADYSAKRMTLEVNGNKYELNIEDEYDQLVQKMGLQVGGAQTLSNVKAPMPGLILDIMVEPGQSIEKGDQLFILEAMKMENVLKADGAGVVKSIEVNKGDAVDKGQILIEME